MSVCECICVYVHIDTDIDMYIHIHICIYIHTHKITYIIIDRQIDTFFFFQVSQEYNDASVNPDSTKRVFLLLIESQLL